MAAFSRHRGISATAIISASVAILLLLTVAAAPLLADGPVLAVEADSIDVDPQDQSFAASGNVRLDYGDMKLKCGKLEYERSTGLARAEGDVELSLAERIIRGSSLLYDVAGRRATVKDGRGHEQGIYFSGDLFEVSPEYLLIDKGSLTTCNLEEPHYRLTARRIEYHPGGRITASRVSVFIGRHRVFYLPFLSWDAGSRKQQILPTISRNDYYGWHLGLGFAMPLDEQTVGAASFKLGTRVGGDLHIDRREPGYDLAFAAELGRQVEDMPEYHYSLLPGLTISGSEVPLGRNWKIRGDIAYGNIHEEPTAVTTWRAGLGAALASDDLLPEQTEDLKISLDWRHNWYGSNDSSSWLGFESAFSRPLGAWNGTLKYAWHNVRGESPFVYDRIRAPHRLEAAVSGDIGTRWSLSVGAIYDLSDGQVRDVQASLGRYLHCVETRAVWKERAGYIGLEMNLVSF